MSSPTDVDEEAAPPLPEPSTELLFGSGQAAWLAVVTVMAALALVVAFVALLRDGGGGDGAAAPMGPSGPATELVVEGGEWFFEQSSSAVVAGTEVAVTFENVGSVDHEWAVLAAGVTIADEDEFDEADVLVRIGPTGAGTSADGSVELAEGDYQVICSLSGHFSAGMEATLQAVAS